MNTAHVNPVTRGRRRYVWEFGIAMAIYVLAILCRGWLLRGPLHDSQWSWTVISVALLPMIPVALMVIAIVRCVRSMDEMLRRIQTESLAIAGVVTALVSVTYGLLEGPKFPHLSAWWTYCVFMSTWLVMSIALCWRYAR